MGNSLLRIVSLAKLVLIDGLRRYALIGLVLFALAAEVGGLLFFDFIPRDIGRAVNDFLFSVLWLTGFIYLLFHCVQTSAWDDGRRVIHTLLARPISRIEYALGIFMGLSLLLLLLNFCLSLIGWIILSYIKGTVSPVFFQELSLPIYIGATFGICCIELMILAVILFFAGSVRGNFPVLLLTLSYYFICSGLPVVRESILAGEGDGVRGLTVILKWMTAIFPDFSKLDFKIFVTVTEEAPILTDYLSVFALAIIYIIVVLWFASFLYQRRDLQ